MSDDGTLTPIAGSALSAGDTLTAASDSSDDDWMPRWIVVVGAIGFVAVVGGLYKAAPLGPKRA